LYGVTVYPVIGLEPSDDGASQLTTACPLLAVAVGLSGTVGTVYGTTAFEVPTEPEPSPLVAATVNV
jgi:hypothetical protein